MWKDGNKILFSCEVAESGKNCLSGGWVELNTSNSNQQSSNAAAALKSNAVFQEMAERLKQQPEVVSKIGAIFQWNITKDGKAASTWSKFTKRIYFCNKFHNPPFTAMDLRAPPGNVKQGTLENNKPITSSNANKENESGSATSV